MSERKDIDKKADDHEPVDTNDAQAEMHIEKEAHARRSRISGQQRLIIFGVAGLVVIAIGAYLLLRKPQAATATPTDEAAVVSVRVAKAEKQPIASQVTALGTIFPHDTAQVSSKISAQIKQMALLKNRLVHAGDVLAVLESRDLQAQRGEAVAALGEARASARSVETGTIPQNNAQDQKALRDAHAAVSNARAIYERRLTLYQQGGISKKDLEAAQFDLTKAEADLNLAEQTIALRAKSLNPNDRAQAEARVNQAAQHVVSLDAQLSYSTVRAPITGIVTDQALYEGSFVASGTTMVTIADISQVIVKAPIADTVAAQMKIGDSATVLPTDMSGEQMTGQVTLISSAVDPANRTVEVWITLGNGAGRLRANGAAQVVISTQARNDTIVVPASAVTLEASNADEGTMMVVDAASVAHETKVKVGIRTTDKIEITEGLQGGETVVIEGNYALPDGTKVEIAEDKPTGADSESGKDGAADKPAAGEKP